MQMMGILKNINVKKSPVQSPPTAGNRGSTSSFDFNPIDNPSLVVQGVAPSTATRATIATVIDFEGIVREVLSGEMRFGGMRRVQNLLGQIAGTPRNQAPNLNATGAGANAPTVNNNDTYLGETCLSATFPVGANGFANSNFNCANTQFSLVIGRSYRGRYRVALSRALTGAENLQILITGVQGIEAVNFTSAFCPTVFTEVSLSTAPSLAISAGAVTVRGYPPAVVAGTPVTMYLVKAQCEDVTGQANQNPSEYLSVGVLASPWQGANVDGVQYFNTANGNTVVANVVTEATGARLPITNATGFIREASAVDLLLARADARDMTTINWALGATLTRARNQVGADGAANTATLLTGGAVAATNRISMTFALAAANRTYSLLLKRGVGAGPVLITGDNFVTTVDISALLNTVTFTKVSIAANVLNPVIGLQVSTAADTIIADWNQYEAGDVTGLYNSRIPTSITTRNTDVVTYSISGWYNASAGSLYSEWYNPNTVTPFYIVTLNDGTSNNTIGTYGDTAATKCNAVVISGGVTQSLLNTPVIAVNSVCKAINIYQANNFAGFVNNNSLGTDVAGTVPAVTQLDLAGAFGGNALGNPLRKVVYYPYPMASATAQSLTV